MTDDEKLLLGKILVNQTRNATSFCEAEFKVFSQFGDDGIIQFLKRQVPSICPYFIEFGVENYFESNTRFLLQNDNWSGLVLDGSQKNIASLKASSFFWKHDLLAVQAFVTAENINELLSSNLPTTNVGILHIDIDGNDYWVWKSINCIEPQVVIVEYNSVFGSQRAITIPYQADFVRTKAHYSNLYAGASLLALCDLADQKGYSFIGSNSAGNNAYFIKKDLLGGMTAMQPNQGYIESKFRESRDPKGNLTFLRSEERIKAISGMKVINTRTNEVEYL